MKNLIQLILISLVIFTNSCQKRDGYLITGNLSGFPDSTMIYLTNVETGELFDSALVIKGKFQLTGQLQNEPEDIWFNAEIDHKPISTELHIGNENVKIEGDIKDFPYDVNITGSKIQDDFNDLRDLTKELDIKRDSLVQYCDKLSPIQREKRSEIWGEIKTIDDTTNALIMGYVKSHINTYPGIMNLVYLKNSIPKDTVQALYNKLSDELKASKYAKVIKVFLDEKISEIGDIYHDFEAFDKNGKTNKFSNLIGKYILLDFTAAYCGACIMSAEELRLIDSTYSDSIEIVSFSADQKKEIWLNSLKRDRVSWISLWDGKGRFSETYVKYGVQGLPTFFLIAPNGIIINKWSGYGKGSLVNKLKRFRNK